VEALKVLVTGGSGFIGTYLISELRNKPDLEVSVFDLNEPKVPGVEWIQEDMLREGAFLACLRGFDVVYHLAAIADVDEALGRPRRVFEVNEIGTLNLLKACVAHEVKRIVLASSVWVYGPNPKQEVTETEPVAPPAHIYTATKIGQENLVHAFNKTYGLPFTILRFDIPYGTGMRPNTVFAAWAKKVLEDEPIVIYGTGNQGRCFLHVSDLARGIASALSPAAKNQIFNLGGPKFVTLNELADLYCELFNAEKRYDMPKSGDFMGVRTCSAKAKNLLGWETKIDLKLGVKEFVKNFAQAK